MMAKPMKTLELHYLMIQFLFTELVTGQASWHHQIFTKTARHLHPNAIKLNIVLGNKLFVLFHLAN